TSGNVNMDNEAQIVQSISVAAQAGRQFHSVLSPVDLVKRISVSVPPNTTFLQVQCSESTASLASMCANSFGRTYLTNRRRTAVNAISSELSALTSRISTIATRIATLKARLASLPTTAPAHTKVQLS